MRETLVLLCLSLKKKGVRGENNISDSSRINPKCLDQKQLPQAKPATLSFGRQCVPRALKGPTKVLDAFIGA